MSVIRDFCRSLTFSGTDDVFSMLSCAEFRPELFFGDCILGKLQSRSSVTAPCSRCDDAKKRLRYEVKCSHIQRKTVTLRREMQAIKEKITLPTVT